MSWSVSGVFGQTLADILGQTAAMDLNTHSFKIALYTNSITPDFDAAAASIAYDTGQWATAQEAYGTNWAQGGVALTSPTLTVASPAATQLKWDTADVSESNTTVSTTFYGAFIYDDTIATPVADQGLCAIYFGGSGYTTSTGTLSITVDTSGWFYIDYA